MTKRVRLVLLAAAAAAYCLAAWLSPPGFYDGICPPVTSYNWLVTPPGQRSGGQPGSASLTANNSRGPYFASTSESNPQAQLSWVPQGFGADANATVTITIKPTTKCLDTPPSGVRFTTNVYDVEASAKLVKQGNLRLVLAPDLPSATVVYHAGSDCQWTALTNTSPGACGDLQVRVGELGYYAAGVANVAGVGSGARRPSGSQGLLPWIVAGVIVVVMLAGLPLALVRRGPARRGGGRANPQPGRRPRRRT